VKFSRCALSANERLTQYRERLALGLIVSEKHAPLLDWMNRHPTQLHPLLPSSIAITKAIYFDLTLPDQRGPDQVDAFSHSIAQAIAEAGASLGIGRYNENRHCYQSEVFQNEHEARSVHLGIDLFAPPFTQLFAPFPGTVHSLCNNANFLDYGPTIILHHRLPDADVDFFSLYGHLSLSSLDGFAVGDTIDRGQAFAQIGNYPENGHWPAHVHVQLILDMLDYVGDYPGVASPADAELWLQLCPDPSALLKLPQANPSKLVTLAKYQ